MCPVEMANLVRQYEDKTAKKCKKVKLTHQHRCSCDSDTNEVIVKKVEKSEKVTTKVRRVLSQVTN